MQECQKEKFAEYVMQQIDTRPDATLKELVDEFKQSLCEKSKISWEQQLRRVEMAMRAEYEKSLHIK